MHEGPGADVTDFAAEQPDLCDECGIEPAGDGPGSLLPRVVQQVMEDDGVIRVAGRELDDVAGLPGPDVVQEPSGHGAVSVVHDGAAQGVVGLLGGTGEEPGQPVR